MRLLKSVPKNREFYNEHGRNLRAFATIANIGQLLSALSLSLAVFSILRDALNGRGMSVATGAIIAAAVLVGVFIELANRKLVRPALRPLVVKDQFADDADRQQRHRLLTRFSRAGLLVVGSLSFVLSFVGSMDAGELMATPPPPANVDSLQLAFAADTAVLLAPLNLRKLAAGQQFEATKNNREKAAEDYTGCSDRGNKWCKKKQREILAEIDAARAQYNATLAAIATERGNLLTSAIKGRDDAIIQLKGEASAAADKVEGEAANNGYIFAVLTFAGQVVFYLMYYLILQITAGSEIEETIEPNEFATQPSVIADLRAVLSHRVERGSRRLIYKMFGERERLDKGLPYVGVWSTKGPDPAPDDADHHAPGFYRAADDPHTPKARAPFIAHGTHGTHTVAKSTKRTHETKATREAKQRLKQYKKRLGEHTQKARLQVKQTGEVNARTAAAIENNRQWVKQYEAKLAALTS